MPRSLFFYIVLIIQTLYAQKKEPSFNPELRDILEMDVFYTGAPNYTVIFLGKKNFEIDVFSKYSLTQKRSFNFSYDVLKRGDRIEFIKYRTGLQCYILNRNRKSISILNGEGKQKKIWSGKENESILKTAHSADQSYWITLLGNDTLKVYHHND